MRVRKSDFEKIVKQTIRESNNRTAVDHQVLMIESEIQGTEIPPRALAAAKQVIGRSSPDAFALYKNMAGISTSKEKSAVRGIIKRRQDEGTLSELYDEYQTLMDQMKEDSKGFWNKFKKQGSAFLAGSAFYGLMVLSNPDLINKDGSRNYMMTMMHTNRVIAPAQRKMQMVANASLDKNITPDQARELAGQFNQIAQEAAAEDENLPETDAEIKQAAKDENHPYHDASAAVVKAGDGVPDEIEDLADDEQKKHLAASHHRSENQKLNEIDPVSGIAAAKAAAATVAGVWSMAELTWSYLSPHAKSIFSAMGMPDAAAEGLGGASLAGVLAATAKTIWDTITPSEFDEDLVEWLSGDGHKDEAEAVKSALKAKA